MERSLRKTTLSPLLFIMLSGGGLTMPGAAAATAEGSCVGDCDGDAKVVTAELIEGVRIALDRAPIGSCSSYDSDRDGAATITELVGAVHNSLAGCDGTEEGTPTSTPPSASTPTPSATPGTPPTPAPGPVITFFAVLRGDGSRFDPVSETPTGVPIFERPLGSGFHLVVEAGVGPSGRPVGTLSLGGAAAPDLQIQATRQLGNGDSRICDVEPPNAGGVPAIDPPRFDDSAFVTSALNDFGCRFTDGRGQPRGRGCTEENGCVAFASGQSGCVSPLTRTQFCATVDAFMAFPLGDTLVTVRVRDMGGNLGDPAQLVVRVLNE